MWARITSLLLMAACGGCAANMDYLAPQEQTPPPEAMAATPPGRAMLDLEPEPADVRPAGPEEIKSFELAVELITQLEYAKAISALRPLPPRFEEAKLDRYAAESLFWLGYAHERLKDIGPARDYYARLIRRYPDTAAGRQGRMRLRAIGESR